ncbi:hypothetical protein AMK01_CH01896 [Rhizobium sp. N6212]|nr:hypothetical protein AMK01_CH01896 [Rhizobium sp. N6212]ANK97399.1 hypothetical protein AMK00_CH01898 [Rhizobium sp. N621]ANL03519.1 hypothetical protein AMJ99_CH01966 [Rhizobium esperanzae]ANL09565.1 hypothetical protein AMJ98_CH01888 [Rhizobium sp. N1341]ANL21616.1 hypothetical protein AMJ96_CH01893 [Rhizobium sp. N113]ANM34368.1 hypothetical protein AMK04_CH01968 [Rhizobium sp. N871]ANM40406.1 hypothetical protein AMK03_CH01888 [Rhizobium sp. N741]
MRKYPASGGLCAGQAVRRRFDEPSVVGMASQSGAITHAALRLDVTKNPVGLAFPVTQRSQYRMC